MSFLKESLIYGLSNGLTAAVQFGFVFLFSSILGPEGFGHFSVFLVCYMAFSMLTGLGLTAAVQRSYFQMDFYGFGILVSTIIKTVIYFSAFVAIVVLILPISITKYLLLPKEWIIFALIAAIGQVFIQIILIILQSQKKVFIYFCFVILQILLIMGSASIFYFLDQATWQRAVLAQSAAPIITGLVVIIYLLREGYRFNAWSKKLLYEALDYSIPLIPHQLSSWIMTMADRFIIGNYFGVAHVGVYSLSFQIAQSFNIVSNSLNQAVVPLVFGKLTQSAPDWFEIRRINLAYMMALLIFFAVFLAAFLLISPYLVKAEYKLAISYAPLIFISFLFLSASRIGSNYLMYYRKTRELASVTVITSMISIALNFALIPTGGISAACWVSVGTFILLFFLTSLYAINVTKRSSKYAFNRKYQKQ